MSDQTQTSQWIPLPPLLSEAKEAAIDDLHRHLAEKGYGEIRPSHGCVFRYVGEEGMRLTELAELTGFTKQAVGEFVAELEQKGYVERIPDPADRRAKSIRLTKRGAQASRLAQEYFVEIERRWAKEIGVKKMLALREALEQIVELERAPAEAA
jgi:DNA-binding MarR family transcriptional regulator